VITEAIILAGGFGTRLQPVVSNVPKSMAPVHGRPFLEYLLDYLISQGIRKVVLSVGYKSQAIRDHFGPVYRDLDMAYAAETEPLGTGGGIRNAFRLTEGEEAFVLNGDSIFKVGLAEMYRFHISNQGFLTLALRHVDQTGRFGSVRLDQFSRIIGFAEKSETAGPGYINGGVYILRKDFILNEIFPDQFSIEKDCFELYFKDVTMLGFLSEGYFLDIGIPGDYERANHEFDRLGS